MKERLFDASMYVLSHEWILHTIILFVGVPVVLWILCLISPKFKAKLLMRLRQATLKRKVFWGSYSSNMYEMKRFYNQHAMGIMPQHIEDDSLKVTFTVPDKAVQMEMTKVILKEQARQQRRELRKEHRTVLWYVDDIWWNKLLGWRQDRQFNRKLEK